MWKKFITIVFFSAIILPAFLIFLSTSSLAATPPASCSIETWYDSSDPFLYRSRFRWQDTYEQWYLFHWGDEAVTGFTSPGFRGPSGEVEWAHYYHPGTWEQWANVTGPGGSGGCKVTIEVKPSYPTASCSISTKADNGNPLLFHTTFSWNDLDENWYKFYWGDEEFTSAESPGFRGPYGTVAWDHVYQPGTWEQWAYVDGPGGSSSCLRTITAVSLPEPAFCEIITSPDSQNPNLYHTTINWQNAYEQWHRFFWGDEEFTASESPGYFGNSGSQSWIHEYENGKWEQWSNLDGPGGGGGCLVRVTVD